MQPLPQTQPPRLQKGAITLFSLLLIIFVTSMSYWLCAPMYRYPSKSSSPAVFPLRRPAFWPKRATWTVFMPPGFHRCSPGFSRLSQPLFTSSFSAGCEKTNNLLPSPTTQRQPVKTLRYHCRARGTQALLNHSKRAGEDESTVSIANGSSS